MTWNLVQKVSEKSYRTYFDIFSGVKGDNEGAESDDDVDESVLSQRMRRIFVNMRLPRDKTLPAWEEMSLCDTICVTWRITLMNF